MEKINFNCQDRKVAKKPCEFHARPARLAAQTGR